MSPFRAIFPAPPWARKFFLVGAQKNCISNSTLQMYGKKKMSSREMSLCVGQRRNPSLFVVICRYLSEYVVFTHSHTNSHTNSLTLQGGCVLREKIIYIKNIFLILYNVRVTILSRDRKTPRPPKMS